MNSKTVYAQIIETIFLRHYRHGLTEFDFLREELQSTAAELNLPTPKNLGDIVYSFKFRNELPPAIVETAPPGLAWTLRNVGTARYRFQLRQPFNPVPNPLLAETKVPDATPGLVAMYAQTDEQALLAMIRYNRLIDLFARVTCYSLQNHLRTTVRGVGQIETDELYVGVGANGAHYVFPIQAKGGRDRLGEAQIEQDIALCRDRFPELVCRPIGAQFMADQTVALFEFVLIDDVIRTISERHYRLVQPGQMTTDDLRLYRSTLDAL